MGGGKEGDLEGVEGRHAERGRPQEVRAAAIRQSVLQCFNNWYTTSAYGISLV